MSSQFQWREFLLTAIEIDKKKKEKKDKGAVEAGRFATKQMGLGKSREKRKKMTSDRKRVNINQNAIPSI